MRSDIRALVFSFLLLVPEARAHDQIPGKPQNHPVLLRGGDLYTVSGGVLEHTDLLFAGGKIAAIGTGLTPPAGADVVDVSGQRVYPGLIAPQTNLGLIEIEAVRATSDLSETGSLTPEAAAHTAFNPDSELIPTVRSHGITTAQVVPTGSLLRGRPFLTHLDGWTKEQSGIRLLDGMELSWPAGAPRDEFGPPGQRLSREEREKARRENLDLLARSFEEARAQLGNRTADPKLRQDLRWEALGPVLSREQPLYVVADRYAHIVEALEFARRQRVRLVLVGGAEAYRLIDELTQADVAVIAGNTQGLPEREDDPYDMAFRLPVLLHEAGVRFCLADVGGSWSTRNLPLHAAQAVAFGLPPEAALRALTLSAAEILGLADRQGSLEVGKEATLFVSAGDVLDSLDRRVTRMWIQGRAVDLDDRHKELFRKYKER